MSGALADPAPLCECEHYTCRCTRAEELSQMADRIEERFGPTGTSMRLRAAAIDVHQQRVRCRLPIQLSRR